MPSPSARRMGEASGSIGTATTTVVRRVSHRPTYSTYLPSDDQTVRSGLTNPVRTPGIGVPFGEVKSRLVAVFGRSPGSRSTASAGGSRGGSAGRRKSIEALVGGQTGGQA